MESNNKKNSWSTMKQKTEHIYVKVLKEASERVEKSEMTKLKSPIRCVKNNTKSGNLRLEGNEYFEREAFAHALDKFTSSLRFAEKNSLQQALAFSNRSAVLFQKGYYSECLQDIDRAINAGYPEEKMMQLIDRQQRALKLLPKQKKIDFHDKTPELKNANPLAPSLADSVRITKNEKFGTFIQATRDIQVGETLLVEKPYVWDVEQSEDLRYCSECGELCFNMIACDACLRLYCSEGCKNGAFLAYHRYECVVDRYFQAEDTEIHPVYESQIKISLRITLKGLKDMSEQKHKHDGKYHSDCYEEIGSLITHKSDIFEHREDQVFLQIWTMLRTFYLIKNHTDVKTKFNLDDDTLQRLMFHDTCVWNMNGVQNVAIDDIDSYDTKCTGHGLYAAFSRFNHSCCPNVRYLIYGSTMVGVAKRAIKKGEQCFIEYMGNYYVDDREYRQERGKSRYFFECDCKACQENWSYYNSYCDPFQPGLKNYVFGPTDGSWYVNLRNCHKLRAILHKLRTGSVKPNARIWKALLKIYDQLEPEPSPSYGYLNNILYYFTSSCNKVVEF